MDLQKELQEVIEKNLPKATGADLQKRLSDADKFEEGLKLAKIRGEGVDRENKKLKQEIEVYMANDKRNAELDKREKEVEKRESDIELADIKNQLETAEEKTQFCKEVALGLVRNTTYRKTIFDSENQAGYQTPSGEWIYPTPVNKSLTEENTKE